MPGHAEPRSLLMPGFGVSFVQVAQLQLEPYRWPPKIVSIDTAMVCWCIAE